MDAESGRGESKGLEILQRRGCRERWGVKKVRSF